MLRRFGHARHYITAPVNNKLSLWNYGLALGPLGAVVSFGIAKSTGHVAVHPCDFESAKPGLDAGKSFVIPARGFD